jgi:Gpi18-like mannosyltransferase
VTRWRALFGAAVVLALLVGHLLRDTPGYAVRNPDDTLTGDITHYVYWTRLVTLGGIQSAYSGTWPETYAVYPPVTLYPLELIGAAYQLLQDPSFDPERAQESLWLHEAIKSLALVWHLLTAAAIFFVVRRLADEPAGALAASLYVVNPAGLYDVAHWAQPDGAHSVFSVVAIGLLSLGQLVAPWAAIAAAALAKPQAWSIVPLLVIATLRLRGVRGLIAGLGSGAVVGTLIILPFVISGRLGELLTLPWEVSSVMPVVSADAHNVWWLVLQPRGLDPLYELDSARAIGPLTYRGAGTLLVIATAVFTGWLYWTRRASLAEAASLSVLGWFTFTTQAHENHLFFVFPLLSLAWPTRRWLLVPFVLLSVVVLLNMVLHDQLVLERLGLGLQDPLLVRLRLANAALTVASCGAWSLLAALRRPDRAIASATVNYWPRHTTNVGLEANG